MISVNNLSYYLGDRPIFDDASLHIKPKDKIGLIGLNGTGKSTLLKIINGDTQPTYGSVSKGNECTVGFLNQDLLSYESEESILHVALQAFSENLKIEKQLEEVMESMATDHSEATANKLAYLQERYEKLGGYEMRARAEEILEGIGFNTSDLYKPLNKFSGGWRMRVMLAKLLLESPSLLMLDEPTNHLDLPSIQWIENYLKNYEGAVIIVSHDQQFLDNTVSSIVEVEQAKLNLYYGNYSQYLQEKEERKALQKSAFENQQKKIKQQERFIERFRAKANKASQVQSRVKQLNKMEMVENVEEDNTQVNFTFKINRRPGRFLLELNNISKAYGDLEILKNTSHAVERGDKIALIGANGKGKSTLLRIMANTETFEGERKIGHNVDYALFAQHQLEDLKIENEILQELKDTGTQKNETELRRILGNFLFTANEVFKKIKVLSGGERSRVALAKTLLSESNFLLLDEPTNHLDIRAVDILIQSLQQFEGSLVMVSHDRHFISEVANKIWYIEDKTIKEYPGSYEEFQIWWQKNKEAAEVKDTVTKKASKASNKKKENTHQKTEEDKALKQLRKKLEKVEKDISEIESKKNVLEEEMSASHVLADHNKLHEKSQELEKINADMAEKNQEWEEIAIKIDEMEQA